MCMFPKMQTTKINEHDPKKKKRFPFAFSGIQPELLDLRLYMTKIQQTRRRQFFPSVSVKIYLRHWWDPGYGRPTPHYSVNLFIYFPLNRLKRRGKTRSGVMIRKHGALSLSLPAERLSLVICVLWFKDLEQNPDRAVLIYGEIRVGPWGLVQCSSSRFNLFLWFLLRGGTDGETTAYFKRTESEEMGPQVGPSRPCWRGTCRDSGCRHVHPTTLTVP